MSRTQTHPANPAPAAFGAQHAQPIPGAGTPQSRSSDVTELLAVMLPRYGSGQVLGPGQLVPLWDLADFANGGRTSTPFELQGYFAVRDNGQYACEGRQQAIDVLDKIQAVASAGGIGSDLSQMARQAEAEEAVLGDVGGMCIIRPGRYPVGMVPIDGKQGLDGKCFELRDLRAAEFHGMLKDYGLAARQTTEQAPRLAFFVAHPAGAGHGWDVVSDSEIRVVALPLPASFHSAQEMGLIAAGDRTGDGLLLSQRAAVVHMLRARGITSGVIYVGFEMGATPPSEHHWELDEINTPGGLEVPLYALPWSQGTPGRGPLSVLNPGARATVEAMVRGDFARPAAAQATLIRR